MRTARTPAPDPAPDPASEGETATPLSTIRLDARALRVLAHPLRSRLLTALRLDGPATATTLAGALATNTGATSYHLRRLASVGLVEETDAGRGRERWWRASSTAHSWTERDVAGDPDGEAASDWLRRSYLRTFVEGSERWLAVQRDWPIEWREAADWGDALVRVTPAQLVALRDEMQAVLTRFRDPTPDDPAAEAVAVYVQAIPLSAVREAVEEADR
jgi:DNA-binding transcriptional ArsR family regulator